MTEFDDARLEDRGALLRADDLLRRLAQAGRRIRIESEAAKHPLAGLEAERPRAVIVVGGEARLIRAMLEPCCPVPLMAWPSHGLPGWVGPLDLVVVVSPTGQESAHAAAVREAGRRGSRVLLACPEDSAVAGHVTARATTLLATTTHDALASAVVVLAALHTLQLGPALDLEGAAQTLDRVAEDCSPFVDLSANPAKEIALGLADGQPLIWGGSVLAARASRRVAEALRGASGRPALAADATELRTVVAGAAPADLFADPFDSVGQDRRPALVVLDDGADDDLVRRDRVLLLAAAERAQIRTDTIRKERGEPIERYLGLLQTGLFAAAYLAVGLGRLGES